MGFGGKGKWGGGWDDGWGGKGGWDDGKGGWGGKGGYDEWSWMMMMKGMKGKGGGWGGGGGGWGGKAKGGWGGGGGGGGGSAPAVFNIEVGPDNAVVAAGFPATAPAVVWSKEHEVFSASSYLINDICEDCVIDHDPDWERYPDIAKAIQALGGPDDCIAVARSASCGKWGVALASGWQGRERAGKVALALSIAAGTDLMGRLARNFPEWAVMCGAGQSHAGAAYQAAPKGGDWGGKGGDWGGKGGDWGGGAEYGGGGGVEASFGAGEVPPVHLIAVDAGSQLPARGYPAQAYAVDHGGKEFKTYFQNAANILNDMIGDMSGVTLDDDPDWALFPEVAEAIKAAGGEENCQMIAHYEAAGVWAVGTAAGKKPRESAAKMALAMTMLPGCMDRAQELLANYPEFGPLCAAAGIELGAAELAAGLEPAAKKQKLGAL